MFELTNPERAEKAPAAIVSLIGQKEYEQCAEDLYFFLQVNIQIVSCISSSIGFHCLIIGFSHQCV